MMGYLYIYIYYTIIIIPSTIYSIILWVRTDLRRFSEAKLALLMRLSEIIAPQWSPDKNGTALGCVEDPALGKSPWFSMGKSRKIMGKDVEILFLNWDL